MSKLLDQVHVRAIYTKDPIARVLLDYVADRRRALNAISADSIIDLCEAHNQVVTREMVMATMRELEEAGAGVFLCGRRGHVSRLRFSLTSRIVGMVAKGLHDLPAQDEAVAEPPVTNNVVPMARKELDPVGSVSLGDVRELLSKSSVDELRQVATYIGKMIELREMEGGNFAMVSKPFGRRSSDHATGN
jgi:hypothetical protein